jgi:DNA adenine methylase
LVGKNKFEKFKKEYMKYMGSKARIAKEILPIILKDRKPEQWYIEPFVGGANMIDKVEGKRIGADNNEYLIEALILIRDNPNEIPELITEQDYQDIKKEMKVDGLTGFVGFAMSFGGKWFGGYRRDIAGSKGDIENMKTQTRRSKQNAIEQSKLLQGVKLVNESYLNLEIPPQSIIYCDPPYEGSTKYKDVFNHGIFWDWCRAKHKEGHTIYISEYNAPKDFVCVWQKEIATTISKQQGKIDTEKLFTLMA